MRSALAGHVFQAVGDVRPGGDFAEGRDAAVAQPARAAVDAGAVQHDVGLLDALPALVVAQEQAERLPAAAGVAGVVALEEAAPADLQHGRVLVDGRRQGRRQRQRLQVDGEMLPAGQDGVGLGQGMLRLVGADAGAAQRRRVQAERAEHADVAPAAQVLADPAAFVDGERQVQRRGAQGGLQSDRPGAEDGDSRRFHPRHGLLPPVERFPFNRFKPGC